MNVLYLDNHLLVVSKPPGLLSQADRTGDADVLSRGKDYLRRERGKAGGVYLGLVHRLDRPASGVMVLARTSKAARRLGRQFREREVGKRYLALVEGVPKGWGTRTDYLVKERPRVRVVSAEHPDAKRAELAWQRLADDGRHSLLMIRPQTGRPHQIRVQMAAQGHPLVGDPRYGARGELDGRTLALHAYHLRIEHPTRREGMAFTTLPPEAWSGSQAWSGRFEEAVRQVLSRHAAHQTGAA